MAARLLGRSGLVILMALCAFAVPAAPPSAQGTGRAAGWQVVLAAGDGSLPVFDDATMAFARRLRAAGVPQTNIHLLSSRADALRAGVAAATRRRLLRRIAGLPVRRGGRCLVFLTSHGVRGAGLWLALSGAALTPHELARALADGGAGRSSLLRMPGRPDLYLFRPVPTAGLAGFAVLARRLRAHDPLRAHDGRSLADRAIRAAGLFRRRRQEALARVLTASMGNDDPHVPLPAGDVDRDLAAVAAQQYVGDAVLEPQPAQMQLVKKLGQHRSLEADLRGALLEVEAKTGLHQGKNRRARPGLRRAGHRVEGRGDQAPPRKTAEQLRQSPQIHIPRRLEQTLEDLEHARL